MIRFKFILVVGVAILFGCNKHLYQSRLSKRETIQNEKGIQKGNTITDLSETNKFIEAVGTSIVLDKYPEAERNVLIARRGAILDAQRNLAEKIVGLMIESKTRSINFEIEEEITTKISAHIVGSEIVNEYHDSNESRYYNVILRISRENALKIINSLN